jgi:hypothetical protein
MPPALPKYLSAQLWILGTAFHTAFLGVEVMFSWYLGCWLTVNDTFGADHSWDEIDYGPDLVDQQGAHACCDARSVR